MGKYGSYGWIKQQPDERDVQFSVGAPVALPAEVSLRSQMPVVWDQGQLGSCTAHGIGAALDYQRHKQSLNFVRPSRLFIYYNERALEGTISEDAGASVRDGIKVVNSFGAPPEGYWPYYISRFAAKPSATAYTHALTYTALSYHAVAQSRYAFQYAISIGKPIVFGFTVYDNFESSEVASTGIVPMPAGQILGGHCVLMMGYKQINGKLYFECRNSWSANWGDSGYFFIPADFLTNPNLASDFWVIDSEGIKPPSVAQRALRGLTYHLPGVKP